MPFDETTMHQLHKASLHRTIETNMRTHTYAALPSPLFSATQCAFAFQMLRSALHIGKVVVALPPAVAVQGEHPAPLSLLTVSVDTVFVAGLHGFEPERLVHIIESMVLSNVQEVGLTADIAVDDHLMESGMDSLASTEVVSSIQRELGQAVKLSSTLLFDYPTGKEIAQHIAGALESHLTTGAESVSHEDVLQMVLSQVGKVMPGSSISVDDPLMESGIDSLGATELQNSLQRELGIAVKLPSTLVFDSPTAAEITQFVASQLAIGRDVASGNINGDIRPVRPVLQQPPTGSNGNLTVIHPLPLPQLTKYSRVGIQGMACMAAGGVNSPIQLWDTLMKCSCLITKSTPHRWQEACALSQAPQSALVGAFVDDGTLDEMKKKAALGHTDLHIQLLTTIMSQALDDAGSMSQSGTEELGIFTAAQPGDFLQRVSSSSISRTVALSLKAAGPHGNLDAECSSGYLAIASAQDAIQKGECVAAVVGGVFLLLKSDLALTSLSNGLMSPSGSCNPLSESADGTIWGEACGAVVFQQAARCEATLVSFMGHAVVENSSKLPLGFADADTMAGATRLALLSGGLQPKRVTLVHLHAMGSLGSDLPEARGVLPILAANRSADQLVLLGHKSSLGHSVAASGILAAIVTTLSLQQRVVPVPANVGEPLRLLEDIENILLPTRDAVQLDAIGKAVGAINGTSVSGHNVHMVLQHDENLNRSTVRSLLATTRTTHAEMTACDSLHRLTANVIRERDLSNGIPSSPQPTSTDQTALIAIKIRYAVAVHLDVGADSMSDTCTWSQLGLTSVQLIKLGRQLSNDFGVGLVPVNLLLHSNIKALAIHMVELSRHRDGALESDHEIVFQDVMQPTEGAILDADARNNPTHIIMDANPIDQDSMLVRLASISKTVIALAVLRLVEDSMLRLDQSVTDILPYFKPGVVFGPPMAIAKSSITISQLMTHSSGLGYGKSVSSTGDMVDELYDRSSLSLHLLRETLQTDDQCIRARPLEVFVRQLACMPLKFEPGSAFEYAFGHAVLGDVIETICQKPLHAALEEIVFQPLGIKTARFLKPPQNSFDEFGPMTRPSEFELEVAELELGDSGLAMSARDLYTLLASLNPYGSATKLLSDDTLEEALAPRFKCDRIDDVAVTSLSTFAVVENWSLLGPLHHNKLLAIGGYGALSVIDRGGKLKLAIQDKLVLFWDDLEALLDKLDEPEL